MISVKIRKSMLNEFEVCPAKFKLHWIDGVPRCVEELAKIGKQFHKVVYNFFDLVDWERLKRLNTKDEVKEYFWSIIEPGTPGVERFVGNFIDFESSRFLGLTVKRPEYFFPLERELHIETEHFEGTVDRVNLIPGGYVSCFEYKTGNVFALRSLRQELAWYLMLLNTIDKYRNKAVYIECLNVNIPCYMFEKVSRNTLYALSRRINRLNEAIRTNNFPPRISHACLTCPAKRQHLLEVVQTFGNEVIG